MTEVIEQWLVLGELGHPVGSFVDPTRSQDRALSVATQLSAREREVLGLMAVGASNSAIGANLVISPKTVESHVRNIFIKLWLPPDDNTERRVAAVLAYLQAPLARS